MKIFCEKNESKKMLGNMNGPGDTRFFSKVVDDINPVKGLFFYLKFKLLIKGGKNYGIL